MMECEGVVPIRDSLNYDVCGGQFWTSSLMEWYFILRVVVFIFLAWRVRFVVGVVFGALLGCLAVLWRMWIGSTVVVE